MFYQVRDTKEEEMMQLFVWKFKGEDKLRTFCMTRLVMGNKPSTNISIVAVQESTDLGILLRKIQGVERVAGAGGFKFKEWMIPGQITSGEQLVSLQGYDEVEKALGLYWCLVNDEFFVKLEISDEDKSFWIS